MKDANLSEIFEANPDQDHEPVGLLHAEPPGRVSSSVLGPGVLYNRGPDLQIGETHEPIGSMPDFDVQLLRSGADHPGNNDLGGVSIDDHRSNHSSLEQAKPDLEMSRDFGSPLEGSPGVYGPIKPAVDPLAVSVSGDRGRDRNHGGDDSEPDGEEETEYLEWTNNGRKKDGDWSSRTLRRRTRKGKIRTCETLKTIPMKTYRKGIEAYGKEKFEKIIEEAKTRRSH